MEFLFSVTKKDLIIQFFKGSGPGGQHRNKVETAVRIIHPESGAVGESQSEKKQSQNKKIAFRHLVNSKKFQLWLKRKAREIITKKTIEQIVEEQVQEKNLKFEIKDEKGKWVEEE